MVETYIPKVETGIPIPDATATVYERKMASGALLQIAETIRPGTLKKRGTDGQSVVLPVGSIGKFKKIVKARGLKTVCRVSQSDTEARIWVVR